MAAWHKFKIEIAIVSYWLIHAVNTIHVSREPGYYPPSVREQARMLAQSQPFPWPDIVVAWSVLAMATAGLYLILRNTNRRVIGVLIYSVLMLVVQTIVVPADTGGVQYAIAEYAAYTFLIALCYGAFCWIKERFRNESAL